MHADMVTALAERLESRRETDADLTPEVVEAMRSLFPDQMQLLGAQSELLTSTDAALHVVDAAIPAWSIAIRGMATEPDGHWNCILRESDSPDEDMLGIGNALSLPRAMIAALLRIAVQRVHA